MNLPFYLQLGTINAVMELIKHFNPIHFNTVWTEFNLLEICASYINQNYTTGTDLTSQCDLIYICTNLLAGNLFQYFKFIINVLYLCVVFNQSEGKV